MRKQIIPFFEFHIVKNEISEKIGEKKRGIKNTIV